MRDKNAIMPFAQEVQEIQIMHKHDIRCIYSEIIGMSGCLCANTNTRMRYLHVHSESIRFINVNVRTTAFTNLILSVWMEKMYSFFASSF